MKPSTGLFRWKWRFNFRNKKQTANHISICKQRSICQFHLCTGPYFMNLGYHRILTKQRFLKPSSLMVVIFAHFTSRKSFSWHWMNPRLVRLRKKNKEERSLNLYVYLLPLLYETKGLSLQYNELKKLSKRATTQKHVQHIFHVFTLGH